MHADGDSLYMLTETVYASRRRRSVHGDGDSLCKKTETVSKMLDANPMIWLIVRKTSVQASKQSH
jgi:hypothetical protein